MKVLFTGATSTLGSQILRNILPMDFVQECWCTVHQRSPKFEHSKLHLIPYNLESRDAVPSLPPNIDLLIHFAGLSQSFDESRYWTANYHGTLKLVEEARKKGCRNLVYISSLRAVHDAGAYGESKLKTEEALLANAWDSLTVIRPSEVYGGDGREGIDRFMKMASQYHLVPMIFGNKRINFTPLFIGDFIEAVTQLICEVPTGVRIVNLFGPEVFNGKELAFRIAKKFKAIPVPIAWPGLVFLLKISQLTGWNLLVPDQLQRITSNKAENVTETIFLNKKPLTRFLKDS